MTKDVILSITGLQYEETSEQPVPVEVIIAADYYYKNNSHYILYDEVCDDLSSPTKNRIKLKNDLIEISKKGLTTVNMRFEEGKKNHTYYQTPFGSIFISILTNYINIEETNDELTANISYELEIDSKPLSDCKVQIKIVPKEEAHIA